MTHTKTSHPAPKHLIENYRQRARETERALVELRTDVLALIEAALIRTRSVEQDRATDRTVPGEYAGHSVMFADMRKS
jgi:hypothetical protein